MGVSRAPMGHGLKVNYLGLLYVFALIYPSYVI
jgi:hypothetical protein